MISRPFGALPSGEPVEAWTLNGAGGLTLEVITYGGIVTKLLLPGRDGQLTDVVLGFDSLDSYLAGHPYFGAIAGRVAGRITGAAFQLDGKTYNLARNKPPNHLHGGVHGFDKRVWTVAPIEDMDGTQSLRLSYCSPDGEEGYPGTVHVTVTYTVTPDNVFLIEAEAEADRPTPFNYTHHSYFNLAGESSGSICDHELQIYSHRSVLTDENMTLLGRLSSVDGNGNDFRESRQLGAAIPLLFKNHGDLYLIPSSTANHAALAPAARLMHPGSGRILDVSTTEKYMQLYTGCSLDGSLTGKSGTQYGRFAGVCLECEGYPDGANVPDLGDIILRPGRTLRQATAYAFSIRAEYPIASPSEITLRERAET